MEVVMAYDNASIWFHSVCLYSNFPWTNIIIEESNFQSHFSTEVVHNMIRDDSYESKFAYFLRNCSKYMLRNVGFSLMKAYGNGWLVSTTVLEGANTK